MAAAWEPSPELLGTVVEALGAVSTATNEEHRMLVARVDEWTADPEFARYAAWLLAYSEDNGLREMAGLLLKNMVKRNWRAMPPDVTEYLQVTVLPPLADESRHVRRTACNVLTHMARHVELRHWPGLVSGLCAAIEADEEAAPNVLDGGLAALKVLAEDALLVEDLDSDELGRPMDVIIPRLLSLMSSPALGRRRAALHVLKYCLLSPPMSLVLKMDEYLAALSTLASHEEDPVNQALVVSSLATMADFHLERLDPILDDIVEYIGSCCGADHEDEVRMEALDFWCNFCEAVSGADNSNVVFAERLLGRLPDLCDVLLQALLYSEEQLADLPVDDVDDSATPDRLEDVRPRAPGKGRGGRGGGDDGDSDDDGGGGVAAAGMPGGDDAWTVRRSACDALEWLSVAYQEKLLDALLPKLNERLATEGDTYEAWSARETGVIALGCVTKGCLMTLQRYMGDLFPFLLGLLGDRRPLVRAASAWVLSSRLGTWIVAHRKHTGDPSVFLEPLLRTLCDGLHDHCKYGQYSIISALSTFLEAAGPYVAEDGFVPAVLEAVCGCFGYYQAGNELLLFDCVAVLAEGTGPALATPHALELLMPPLVERWNGMENDDTRLFPLFECLGSLAMAVGPLLFEHAPAIYGRCLTLAEGTLISVHAAAAVGELGPDVEFAVCALDLVGLLIEGVGEEGAPALIDASGGTLLSLLHEAMKPEMDEALRQSALGVLGDLSGSCWTFVAAELPRFLPLLVEATAPGGSLAAVAALEAGDRSDLAASAEAGISPYLFNNATWAAGLIAQQAGADFAPFAAQFAGACTVPLLAEGGAAKFESTTLTNASVCIGRVARVCPEEVATVVRRPVVWVRWMDELSQVAEGEEKVDAYVGLVTLCNAMPDIAAADPEAFNALAGALASIEEPGDELPGAISDLLASFHAHFGGAWGDVSTGLREDVRMSLHSRYGMPLA